jgi:hypothetical protein
MTNEIYVFDNGVKRLATTNEITQHEADKAAYLEQKEIEIKALADKAAARELVAAKLGITLDELNALLH